MASFPQASPPTTCTHLYPPPQAPHVRMGEDRGVYAIYGKIIAGNMVLCSAEEIRDNMRWHCVQELQTKWNAIICSQD